MARIRTLTRPPVTHVIVEGRLGASDMRRLEHACAPALTSAHADLVVDMQRVTEIDGTAAAVLDKMAARGAVLKRTP